MGEGRNYKLSLGQQSPAGSWHDDSATPKQICRLRYLGVGLSVGLTKGQAGRLIDQTEVDVSPAPKLEQWHRDKYRLYPDLYPSEDAALATEADSPNSRRSSFWLLWPLGAGVVIVLAVVPGLRFWEHASQATTPPPTIGSTPPPPFIPLPARESRLRAIQKHPALAEPGSSFNAKFVLAYRKLEAAHSPRLQDANWPELLADDCAGRP